MDQGWGIAYRKYNNRLYATDGSSIMKEIDPATWTTTRQIQLHSDFLDRVTSINELEALPQHNGRYLIGNIWQYDDIHLIDTDTGKIVHTWNMGELRKRQ